MQVHCQLSILPLSRATLTSIGSQTQALLELPVSVSADVVTCDHMTHMYVAVERLLESLVTHFGLQASS
jgi:hypothetical protein